MTYSIVARDPEDGAVAVAVASRFFAVGALVPHLGRDCALASQAFCNPLWGVEALPRLARGEAPAGILSDLVDRDGGGAIRQAHVIDRQGRIAIHTGNDCVDWAGHAAAEDVSVAGNMLTGPDVVADTLAAYCDAGDAPFLERLFLGMEAGERAGGDKRGRQSAAIVIRRGEDYPWLDIRADDHADPLAELRRLAAVSEERFRHFAMGLPTRGNFSGWIDRGPIDAAMARAEDERREAGRPSRSHATGG